MQNFEIVVVDDQKLLDEIGKIAVQIRGAFLRENFQQLSFSEDELRQKKTGLLDSTLPPWLRVPAHIEGVSGAMPLHRLMAGCPALLIVFYDARKRAPASEGDVLGMMSLGCALENMWLMAQSLGLGFQALSVFSGPPVEQAVKNLLAVPGCFKIAFAARLGYPIAPGSYVRVRRAVAEFTHRNRFGNRGLGGPHRQLGAEPPKPPAYVSRWLGDAAMTVLMTGFPGFLGSALLPHILRRTDGAATCLVQSNSRRWRSNV